VCAKVDSLSNEVLTSLPFVVRFGTMGRKQEEVWLVHVKLTLIMTDGSYQKARVTDADSVQEAIAFMKEMRPGVEDAVEGWALAEKWEAEQSSTT
jgi:hypothetical protein